MVNMGLYTFTQRERPPQLRGARDGAIFNRGNGAYGDGAQVMSLLDAVRSALGITRGERTRETIEATRATRRLVTTFSEKGHVSSIQDVETVERVLSPPVDWQDLMRPANGKR